MSLGWRWWLGRSGATVVVLTACGGCTEGRLTTSRSASLLSVVEIAALQGTAERAAGGVVRSDVRWAGQPLDDLARAALRIDLKDPGSPVRPRPSGSVHQVTVEGYRVEYRRTDGRDRPGLDVPHPFDGGLTATAGDTETWAEFVIVRASAKRESPLRELEEGGGAVHLNVIAEVTFFGHDQRGVPVSGRGAVSVHFADWPDPAGETPP